MSLPLISMELKLSELGFECSVSPPLYLTQSCCYPSECSFYFTFVGDTCKFLQGLGKDLSLELLINEKEKLPEFTGQWCC